VRFFRKEDADLRDAFNKVLATFRGSSEQAALFEPFGITSAENPPSPPKTVEELCAGKIARVTSVPWRATDI